MKITRIRLGKLSGPPAGPLQDRPAHRQPRGGCGGGTAHRHRRRGLRRSPAHRPHHRGHHRRHRGGHRRTDRPRSGGAGGGRLRDRHRPGPEGRGAQHQRQGRRGHGPVGPLRPAAPDPGPQAAGAGPGAALSPTSPSAFNPPRQMALDAMEAVARGLRLPEGEGGGGTPPWTPPAWPPSARRWGKDVCIRIDANQAWTPRQAVRIPERDAGQGPWTSSWWSSPSPPATWRAWPMSPANSWVPVMADESVFSPGPTPCASSRAGRPTTSTSS